MIRTVSVAALFLSVFLVGVGAFGIFTFVGDKDWTSILVQQGIDPGDWALHWYLNCCFLLVSGLIGTAAAIGLWWRRRWARAAWLVTISIVAVVNGILFVSKIAPYKFEQPTLLDLVLVFGVGLISWVFLTRRNSF